MFVLAVLLGTFYGKAAMTKLYPVPYLDYIQKECARYEIDPYLMLALIKTESKFDPNATSGKDARGLMQLQDETARWCAEKMPLDGFSLNQLYHAETNLTMGIWYYHYLYDRYGNNANTALAAYNAGPGNVNKWLENRQYSGDGQQLQSIPFPETEQYVDRINFYYKVYQFLYKKEK